MSGGNISYDLRPNKFVERQLFVELLERIRQLDGNQASAYISLGGPQLEDHKLVYRTLEVSTLLSLEVDPIVHQRQLFNLRPSHLDCRNQSTQDFIDNFEQEENLVDKRLIVWLDYAKANARREQLNEFTTLVGKLKDGDIVKITLNANPNTLGERRGGDKQTELAAARFEELQKQIERFMPATAKPEDITGIKLPVVLCGAIEQAGLSALRGNLDVKPLPLALFVYQDGEHQMLTATIRVTSNNSALRYTSDLAWIFSPQNWQDIKRIQIPHLSAKERLHIEGYLPTRDTVSLHSKLPFRFDKDDSKSLLMLEEFALHYRRYPSYFQVIL